ncbi:MAG: hypothetical protein K2M03_03140, partial [Muribaculaceae bacterium]|nr:hypothetical protein [Muribaculaceae bacterium]
TNQDIEAQVAAGTMTEEVASVSYNYTWALVMLACLGVAALFIGLYLKIVDKKKHLGLELPNVQNPEVEESEILSAEG